LFLDQPTRRFVQDPPAFFLVAGMCPYTHRPPALAIRRPPPPQPPGPRAQHIEGQPRPDIGSSLIYSPRANINILSNSKSPSRPSTTHCLGADLFVALYQHNPAATGALHSLLETPLGIIDRSMVYCHPSPAVTNPGGAFISTMRSMVQSKKHMQSLSSVPVAGSPFPYHPRPSGPVAPAHEQLQRLEQALQEVKASLAPAAAPAPDRPPAAP